MAADNKEYKYTLNSQENYIFADKFYLKFDFKA